MKILIINTFDIHGGAARAANRLHNGLINFGINSKMIVRKKNGYDANIIECLDDFSGMSAVYDRVLLHKYKNIKTLFSPAIMQNNKLIEYINSSDADVVHLHWVAGGYLELESILKIHKPIVWTMHDNWLFTGGCHIMWNCDKYKISCGQCPILNSNDDNDLSKYIWKRKKRVFEQLSSMQVIGVSNWIVTKAKSSSLLKNHNISRIPNMLDTDFFKPIDKIKARSFFNFSEEKKLILFGAMSATTDINKGYHHLKKAIEKLSLKNIEFVVFGNNKNEEQLFQYKTHYLGKINNNELLVNLYSAVDVMIVPSLQENLANVIMESLSCSTPVVAFNVGGNSDMIDHKQNGYLAKSFDIADLTFGIEWILENHKYIELCKKSRKKIVDNFSEKKVIPKYINIYERIIKTARSHNAYTLDNYDNDIFNDGIQWFYDSYQKNTNLNFSKSYSSFFDQILDLQTQNNQFIIYGHGTVGKTIYSLMPEKIVGYVDNSDRNNHPENIKNMKYDKIIISVLGREESIIKYLVEELYIQRDVIITFKV